MARPKKPTYEFVASRNEYRKRMKGPNGKAEQVKTLLDATRGLPPYPFIMLCLYAGPRREEALALQWDSVFLTDFPS